jgi:hypothetical protein
MSEHGFETFTRDGVDVVSRRSSMVGLGGAALAAVMMNMRAPGIAAKGGNNGKKRLKKKLKKERRQFRQTCDAQPGQCQAALQTTCPLLGGEGAANCLALLTPCCVQFTDCNVNAGLTCMVTALTNAS